MDDSTRETAVRMYFAARNKLDVAKELHASHHFNDAISRSYYSAYHIVSMVLFLHGKTYSSHGQLIGAFNKEFITTGLIPKQVGKAISRLFEQRQSADYDVFEQVEKDESEQALMDTKMILDSISKYTESTFSLELQ